MQGNRLYLFFNLGDFFVQTIENGVNIIIIGIKKEKRVGGSISKRYQAPSPEVFQTGSDTRPVGTTTQKKN